MSSIPTNRAPYPVVRPFESVGIVKIISGAASLSSCVTTGLGSLNLGESESVSVPVTATLPHELEPVAPSSRQIHMFPEFSSMVVAMTAVFESSN